ncbi:hypothetical protein BH23GEM9_BH23GEM9_08680 [soil metagenome]
MTLTEKLLRLLLRFAPAAFRSRYGDDYLATYAHRSASAARRGRVPALLHDARELGGTAWLVLRLRTGLGPRSGASARASTNPS